MPTLVLPPRYTTDTIAIAKAATVAGWSVERLPSWRVPDWLKSQEVVLYGEPLFAAAVAPELGLVLLEPTFDWLPKLDLRYRQRQVQLATLREARQLSKPAFVKPVDDKCFLAGVFHSGQELPGAEILPDTSPVLIAEPVCWEVEFRSFVLERAVRTTSVYLRRGQLAQSEDGSWTDDHVNEARMVAERVVSDPGVALPPAVVVDVGLIEGRGWAVVEANAAWGSGIYGCDPSRVLEVVARACVPFGEVSAADTPWILQRSPS